ncbi:hypothetical protein OPV22_026722 [Ensete ventricosum]|uniref:FAF domain-containing protein n=1 Tax=Ensete ventricosum TaxID=4639 RepID=A0AAV8PXV5_ENSVE|nr:hypothetical protein OPV22_026722 [Ensete ventricosum]
MSVAVMQSSSTTFLLRRSRSLLSQESLEICTENLGSETGSEYFSSFMDDLDYRGPLHGFDDEKEEEKKDSEEKHLVVPEDGAEVSGVRRHQAKELKSVNYHRSTGRRSPLKSFPPPLPSISRRNGPCLHMRPHRRDGRLVVEAVLVPSQNYLHVQRVGGRLLLSFIDATSEDEPGYESETLQPHEQQDVDAKDDEATDITQLEVESEEKNCCEEEEVEVVDRGTVVEVKPGGHRRRPPQRRRRPRSVQPRQATTSTATGGPWEHHSPQENKLICTSKRRSRQELLHNMRRCSQLRRPLFVWEPCCIATSS